MGTVIIDEIHLLGEERGPILEVIVSRMRYISSHTSNVVRIVGLSTALANARDLADWYVTAALIVLLPLTRFLYAPIRLGIERVGLYNFRPSVRPIPMEVHIQVGGRFLCLLTERWALRHLRMLSPSIFLLLPLFSLCSFRASLASTTALAWLP